MVTTCCKIPITEPIQFGLQELRESVQKFAPALSFTVHLELENSLSEQGYRTECLETGIRILSGGTAGLLYGLLDTAQAICHEKELWNPQNTCVEPYLKNRGIKFNIPLDARTPSYSDASDSAQHNIEHMWDFSFWTEFLDQMAKNKYNVLSLWSLSPFPSLVYIPEYPLAALADVKRSVKPCKAKLTGVGMYAEDMQDSLVTLKKMTIEEKITFWRSVMEYAQNRCIKIYLFTWNLFVYGTEQTPYGITADQENDITKDYVYCATKALLRTYPLLAGIGVTAGEHMAGGKGDILFLRQTYGRAVCEVLKEQPGREFRLIHRMQMARYSEIEACFGEFPCPFEISFKYSQAHMYANTKPSFIDDFLQKKEKNRKIWLTVRDDDFYMYRWGDPEFAREYLKNMPVTVMTGFYLGADGYTWGRDYMDRTDTTHYQFLAKMWYLFAIWGRLSYNIHLPESYFRQELSGHFGEPLPQLYEAWQNASRIVCELNCVHWHDYDFQWYPEACCLYEQDNDKLVFANVNEFIACSSAPKSEYDSILEFCQARIQKKESDKISPLAVADSIWNHAEQALQGIPAGTEKIKNSELAKTYSDIRALSFLGQYYAFKIRAAVALCTYRLTGEKSFQEEAVSLLQAAASYWKNYSAFSKSLYRPQALSRLCGLVDVQRFDELVDLDVLLAAEEPTEKPAI